jgi:hypothetical protein
MAATQHNDYFHQTLGTVLQRRFGSPIQPLTTTTMRIYFSSLSGVSTTLDVEPTTTVSECKKLISEDLDLPQSSLRLSYGGRLLQDAKTISFYDIPPWATIFEECVDIRALIELYKELKGEEWLSTYHTKFKKSNAEDDAMSIAEV